MEKILNTPILGIVITILSFNIALKIQNKYKNTFLNPLLISIVSIILFLKVTKIPYESYKIGGDIINFFLGPITVVLAIPLYKQFDLLKKYIKEILSGIICGVLVSFITIKIIQVLYNVNDEIINSLIPKSITTPMGVSLANTIGGIEAITIVSILLTGILGAIIAPLIFKIFNIKNSIAKGIALGTSSHALGTTKAFELGEVEGAMSGLSIGIAGIITVILIPILLNIL